MGLDATVRCRCWEEGSITAPPCPLRVDEEGYLEGDVETPDEWFEAVYNWGRSACEHENMHAANECIANWSGYRLFQEALATIGWEHLPALRRTLPEANGGVTSSADAALCLHELEAFASSYCGAQTVLLDVGRDVEIRSAVASHGGVFVLNGRTAVRIGFDPSGVFYVDDSTDTVLFRAKRIRQRRLPEVASEGFELTDLDTGTVFVAPEGIPGEHQLVPGTDRYRPTYPEHLAVEVRTRSAKHFDYILKPLRAVFCAAVETGNPVRWC